MLRIKRDRAPIGAWPGALDSRAPKNVIVVAMANKLARIAWAYLPAATTIDPSPHNGTEKEPAAWKRYALPLSRTTTTARSLPTEVCTGAARTKNSRNGVFAAW